LHVLPSDEVGRGKQHVRTTTRHQAKALFVTIPTYGIEQQTFVGYGHTEAAFDRQSKQILGYFSKWRSRENKLEYLEIPSLRIGKSSQTGQRSKRHILSNCKECTLRHTRLQSIFPGGHIFDPQARVAEAVKKVIDDNATSSSTERFTTFCPHSKPCRSRSMDIHLQSLSQCHNCMSFLTYEATVIVRQRINTRVLLYAFS